MNFEDISADCDLGQFDYKVNYFDTVYYPHPAWL